MPFMAADVALVAETKYLVFILVQDTGKTQVYNVVSRSKGDLLAVIKWYGPWRQYVLLPKPETVWNTNCLEDITWFIGCRMSERRRSAT